MKRLWTIRNMNQPNSGFSPWLASAPRSHWTSLDPSLPLLVAPRAATKMRHPWPPGAVEEKEQMGCLGRMAPASCKRKQQSNCCKMSKYRIQAVKDPGGLNTFKFFSLYRKPMSKNGSNVSRNSNTKEQNLERHKINKRPFRTRSILDG